MRARSSSATRCLAAALLGAAVLAAWPTTRARAQLAPLSYDQGAAGLALALRRLTNTARVLYVTAHPDDEHNGVLVMLSRGRGVRTGLLTVTRGEGGQNEIGPELFDALGVLRTEELAALHRYDGVEQFFGRAYEFGYSFSVEETFQKWGREETLGDVVRVVRRFRPDVILTLPLEAEGGGQHHQATAQLTREAFRAAADPSRFPEQVRAGALPWQARKLYQGGTGGDREKLQDPPPVIMKTGAMDPVLGMSWQQLGSRARSMHKCQGAGQLVANTNEGEGVYFLVDSEPKVTGPESDLMDGIDGSLKGLLRFTHGEEAKAGFLSTDLEAIQKNMDAAQAAFDPMRPDRTLPFLAKALDQLRRTRDRITGSELPAGSRHELLHRLDTKEQDLRQAIDLAAEVGFEVLADDDQVVPGQTFTVTARVWNQGGSPFDVQGVTLAVPEGWSAEPSEGIASAVGGGGSTAFKYAVKVADRARYSQPYWRHAPGKDRHELAVPEDEGLPWSPPDVRATLRYSVQAVTTSLDAPVLWRYQGPWVGGEKQKVVNVVPALAVRLSPSIAVVPVRLPRARKEFRVTLTNGSRDLAPATVALEAPAGWLVEPRQAPVSFHQEGEEVSARFFVTAPARLEAGEAEIRAVARRQGQEYREDVQVVAYDHIQERRLVRPASSRIKVMDVRSSAGAYVGYVMGAGDSVAEAIAQLGVPILPIDPERMAFGDLARFTTIVTGIRAYQSRTDLKSYHQRILKYVEDGGHLVVQYNRVDFNRFAERPRAGGLGTSPPAKTDSPFAPYPAAVTLNRITDENAPVNVLLPRHPLMTVPNRIGPADWDGWVQERGTYFLDAHDPHYVELVSMTDPFPKNPGEKKGALVEARVGKGTWTYVGLTLFRQLPAGTSGAYRLLANLVSRPRGK